MSNGRLMLASVVEEVKRLREELELERAARKTADNYVLERGSVIRQLEAAVTIFRSRCEQMAEELAAVRAQPLANLPAHRVREELYRSILSDIEHALHRLGDGCGFAHDNAEVGQ